MKVIQSTVIMCMVDEVNFATKALCSVLQQEAVSFKVIIVFDGSSLDTIAAMKSVSDHRVAFMINEQNIGLTKSLIKAVRVVDTPYWARIDVDDIWIQGKLAHQLDIMSRDQDLSIVAEGVGLASTIILKAPSLLMSCNNLVIHSSVLVRNSDCLLYDENFVFAQDYELWLRALAEHKKILIECCRFTIVGRRAEQISITKRSRQRLFAIKAKFAHTRYRHLVSYRFMSQISKDLLRVIF